MKREGKAIWREVGCNLKGIRKECGGGGLGGMV